MATEGGAETRIVPMVQSVMSYGVTSKGIYFAPDAKTIQFLDFATAKVSTLAVLDKEIVGDLCVSPDDAYVAFSQLEKSARDLMLVENFR